MLNIFKKKNKNAELLRIFDGRTVKYITKRRVDNEGNVNHDIISKTGRIVLIDNEIRIIDGENDIFRQNADDTKYYTLLSGDGITVEGENKITDIEESYTVYFSYYRK